MSQGSFLVALTGGSASGKTSFVKKLKELFSPEELAVISLDNYYKPISKQKKDEQGEVNFDRPEAINFKRVIIDIQHLKSGKSVEMAEYTFNNNQMFPKVLRINPAPIILVEGLFVLAEPKLKKMFHWILFLDTDEKLALERRLLRDKNERGMQEELVHYQWKMHVLPAYQNHLQPHKVDSDLIIDNNEHFNESLKLVQLKFRELLKTEP